MPDKEVSVKDILSEREVQEMEKFVNNDVMVQAIEKVILYGVYYNGTLLKGKEAKPMMNFALNMITNAKMMNSSPTDEMLGRELRGASEGIMLLQSALRMLKTLKKEEEEKVIDKKTGR